MSTITDLDTSYLVGDRVLPDTEALTVYRFNVDALRDYTYGLTRAVRGAAPPHDHGANGGESLIQPIVSHTWGTFGVGGVRGFELLPPSTGTFTSVTTNGVVDRTNAKRLWCTGALIPGGVLGVRVSLSAEQSSDGFDATVTVAIRHLNSVNYKLGVAPEEQRVEIYIESFQGTGGWENFSGTISDLSTLGDPTIDREVEISLWLTDDPPAPGDTIIYLVDLEVLPNVWTAGTRLASDTDAIFPSLAVREVQSGYGVFNQQLLSKIKQRSNGLNVGLLGSTPGLLATGAPDTRRPYRETVSSAHTHRGRWVPSGLTWFGDGAVMADALSLGYVGADEGGNTPQSGTTLWHGEDLTAGWVQYRFRRSIPAGLGSLTLRVGIFSAYGGNGGVSSTNALEQSALLLMSCTVVPVGGSGDIVVRIFCGESASSLAPIDPDYLFCRLEPEEMIGYRRAADLFKQGVEPFNAAAEVTVAEQAALTLTDKPYRYSKPITVLLTYPGDRPSETAHATADYMVSLRFKRHRSDAYFVDNASLLHWVLCYNTPGY